MNRYDKAGWDHSPHPCAYALLEDDHAQNEKILKYSTGRAGYKKRVSSQQAEEGNTRNVETGR